MQRRRGERAQENHVTWKAEAVIKIFDESEAESQENAVEDAFDHRERGLIAVVLTAAGKCDEAQIISQKREAHRLFNEGRVEERAGVFRSFVRQDERKNVELQGESRGGAEDAVEEAAALNDDGSPKNEVPEVEREEDRDDSQRYDQLNGDFH